VVNGYGRAEESSDVDKLKKFRNGTFEYKKSIYLENLSSFFLYSEIEFMPTMLHQILLGPEIPPIAHESTSPPN